MPLPSPCTFRDFNETKSNAVGGQVVHGVEQRRSLADMKFKLACMSTNLPHSRESQVQLCPCLRPAPRSWAHTSFANFFSIFPKFKPRNQSKLQCVHKTALAIQNLRCTPPAAGPRLPTIQRTGYSCGAVLPTRRLIKLQFRDQLCTPPASATKSSHLASAARFVQNSNIMACSKQECTQALPPTVRT